MEVNHLSFNQNYSCIALGTRSGFSIYNLEPIEMRYHNLGEGMGKIEMLYCTSLLTLVGSGEQPGSSPRKFRLWNSQNKVPTDSLPSTNHPHKSSLAIRTLSIHVFELSSMKCLQVLTIASNPHGLMALSSENSSYLAFPSGSAGGVVLYDCLSLRLLSQIDAHKNNVVSMTFNSTGTIFATASASGTVVRLFSIPSGSHICTFRRGSRPADIHCLSFSNDSNLLAACSSSGTVHIFDVYSVLHASPSETTMNNKQTKSRSQSMDSLGSSGPTEGWANSWTSSAYTYLSMAQSWGTAAVSGLNVLPESMQEYANSIRAVAVARVPPTALSVNGVPQGRMYLAGVLESSASPPPSEVLSRDGQRLSEDDPTTTVFSENLEGNKVYTALESSRADSSSKDWRRVNYGPVSAGGRGDLRMRRVRGAVARKETKIVCNERIVIIEK